MHQTAVSLVKACKSCQRFSVCWLFVPLHSDGRYLDRAQNGLEDEPMDYPLTTLRKDGTSDCFHINTLTKTRTERKQRNWFRPVFCPFLTFLFCVLAGEMIAELVCGVVAVLLYVNTLGADFCYDDRYLNE